MMSKQSQYIKRISAAIEEWLHPGNHELKEAIDKTVNDGLFSFEDIKHQVLTLKFAATRQNLEAWAEKSGLQVNALAGKKVLCLHAGNLPLVGFHDLLSVLMTGGSYLGKISRKDPHLLPTFLRVANKHHLLGESNWSTELKHLIHSTADGVLFAGSTETASTIEEELKDHALIEQITPVLLRTAYFSMAFIPEKTAETMEDLTEAAFRYGGAGCRSVAVVVSPYSLKSIKCEFTDYAERFWLRNPQHQKAAPALFHRYAFNKATTIEQAWLDNFLIEENLEKPKEKCILYWIQGDFNTFREAAVDLKYGLQSLYSTANFIGREIDGIPIEPLSQAQKPPIWWKPDQKDSIRWLQEKVAVI